MNKTNIYNIIEDHFSKKNDLINNSNKILRISKKIFNSIKSNKCIFWCGNGGSAADSQHLSAELVGRFEKERKPFKSIALNSDTSIITALANDYNYEKVFSRQLEALAERGDILIVFSTSGNSKNIVDVLKTARKNRIYSIGILGNNGGKSKKYCDIDLSLKIKNTARIQEMHILIGHIICFLIESQIKIKK